MDAIEEFLLARRAARRTNKLDGLEGVILQLRDRGATFTEIAEFLRAHYQVTIYPHNVSRRIAKLRRDGLVTRSVSSDPGHGIPPAVLPQTPARNAGGTLRTESRANAEGVAGDSELKSGALTRDNSQALVRAAAPSGGKPASGPPVAVASGSLPERRPASVERASNSTVPSPETDNPKGGEPEAAFVRSEALPQRQNTPAPPLPAGRELLGRRYSTASPEAIAEQEALDERVRQRNRNPTSRSS
jgi:hypothetical protein